MLTVLRESMELISHSDTERLSWHVTHENLTRVAKKRAEVDAEEALWLIRGMRDRVHVHLGLCWAHHRGAHGGRLIIEGRVSTGLSFMHADGSSYGVATVDAKVSSDVALLFGALKKMGFTDSQARMGAEAAKPHVGAGLETALVKALAAIPIPMVREEEATYGATAVPERRVRRLSRRLTARDQSTGVVPRAGAAPGASWS